MGLVSGKLYETCVHCGLYEARIISIDEHEYASAVPVGTCDNIESGEVVMKIGVKHSYDENIWSVVLRGDRFYFIRSVHLVGTDNVEGD